MARRFDWLDTQFSNVVVASGVQLISTMMEGVGIQESRGMTVTRMIMDMHYGTATVGGAHGTEIISVGICVVSQEVFAAGVGLDPLVAAEDPVRGWLYKAVFMIGQSVNGGIDIKDRIFDIRAQRKLEGGELVLIHNTTAGGGTSFSTVLTGSIRTLVRLP